MSKRSFEVCPECGARLPEGAEQCDLCGTPVHGVEAEPVGSPEPAEPEAVRPVAPVTESRGVFCNQCGWQNPPGARFCSQCGTKLQEAPAARPVPTRPPVTPGSAPAPAEAGQGMGRQVALIVAAAVLLVLALYLVTVFSRGWGSPTTMTTAGSTETAQSGQNVVAAHEELPLPPQIAAQVDSLEEVVESLPEQEQLPIRRELVNLFIGAGRLDRAAIEQERVAFVENTAEAWTRTGNLYFDWMESIQGEHKPEVAVRAVAAYQRVLEMEPENLDVRTDMAWAYQYDPQRSMDAITETNAVLAKDPEHLKANFNRGVFLLQIGRYDQALESFERVRELATPGSLDYRRAETAVQAVRDIQQGVQ